MTRDDLLARVDAELIRAKGVRFCIKTALEDLFPMGSSVLVRIRDNCKPSIMTVMSCDGEGHVRAYMDTGHKRFVRDFFYISCMPGDSK
jgi:hypothetical protein